MLYISTMEINKLDIFIVAMDDIITEIGFGKLKSHDLPENAATIECKHQLEEYFNGTRKTFQLQYFYRGTDFQEKVWQALATIPYGQTVSYKQLAQMIGSPNAIRAVGNACNSNMLAILIPCHRVVAANGKLSGYAGGQEIKKMLLELEQNNHTS